ncbi:MAG: hypothetical protein ACI9IA_002587 [Enterobacterales bacterium]|jgi:hypothetical protein
MSSFKGFLAIVIWTVLVAFGATELGIDAHHSDPVWALGTAIAFLIWITTAVALFFGVAKDDPFKWEK